MIYNQNFGIINSKYIPTLLELIYVADSSSTISQRFEELKSLPLTDIGNKYLSCKKLIQFQDEIKQSDLIKNASDNSTVFSLFFNVKVEISSELYSLFTNILQTLNDRQPVNNQEKIKKYSELKKLMRLVKESDDAKPEHLKEKKVFINTINKGLKELKDEYQTNSHWLMLTQKNFHLKEIKPELKQKPDLNQKSHIKFDPNNINLTLKQLVNKIGMARVRALLFIVENIEETISNAEQKLSSNILSKEDANTIMNEIRTLKNSLKKVQQFIDRLPLDEQILAIKQINTVDKNFVQERNLTELFDKNGEKLATYFLNRRMDHVSLLSSYLSTVLRDRFRMNPSSCCAEMILKWPTDFDKLDSKIKEIYSIDYRMKLIDQLFELSINDHLEKPLTKLVYEYLYNFVDPTGELRKKHILGMLDSQIKDESKKNAMRNHANAQLINSLCWFGAKEELLLPQVLEVLEAPKIQKFNLSQLIQKLPNKLLSRVEIFFLAQIFKDEVALVSLTFDIKAYIEAPKKHEKLNEGIDNFFQHFQQYFNQMLEEAGSDEKKKNILVNLTILAARLAMLGELNLCCTLFKIISFNENKVPNFTKVSDECKKSYGFLQNLVPKPFNMRKLIKDRTENVNCNPYFFHEIIDYEKYDGANNNSRRITRESIENALPKEDYLTLLGKLSTLNNANDLQKWATDHLFDDLPSLFENLKNLNLNDDVYNNVKNGLEEFVEDELECKLKINSLVRKVATDILLLKICYHGYESAQDTKMVMDKIKNIKMPK
jgi:hypothetical protein